MIAIPSPSLPPHYRHSPFFPFSPHITVQRLGMQMIQQQWPENLASLSFVELDYYAVCLEFALSEHGPSHTPPSVIAASLPSHYCTLPVLNWNFLSTWISFQQPGGRFSSRSLTYTLIPLIVPLLLPHQFCQLIGRHPQTPFAFRRCSS